MFQRRILGVIFVLAAFGGLQVFAAMPDRVNGVYLSPHSYTDRKITEIIHYAKHSDINAVVLHAKDPHGRLYWKSANETANRIGAVQDTERLVTALKQLKAENIWTIAKIDTFQDSRLSRVIPEYAVIDKNTGQPWKEHSGLSWANPHNEKVWEYVSDLAVELAELGFDEVQFDYVRFPSDGMLNRIKYPGAPEDRTKAETIGAFLEYANKRIKPTGAVISVDLFGLVAWKDHDFGVGQVIENIAPHVDVICPMLYPSHFPKGFSRISKGQDFYRWIMEASMKRMAERTNKRVRPWIQGYDYSPDGIIAQIEGAQTHGELSWLMWNPAGIYSRTYSALEKMDGKKFPEPEYYSDLAELRESKPKISLSGKYIVNFTNYESGYSVLSLAPWRSDCPNNCAYPRDLVLTLDEAILDAILEKRNGKVSKNASPNTKAATVVKIMCRDIKREANRMRPMPIFLDWSDGCRFTADPSQKQLMAYQKAQDLENLMAKANAIQQSAQAKNLAQAKPLEKPVKKPRASQPKPSPTLAYMQMASTEPAITIGGKLVVRQHQMRYPIDLIEDQPGW
ncbi:MAG: putative glycoside hydrolase [Candidatus Sumerlaeia bacterium]